MNGFFAAFPWKTCVVLKIVWKKPETSHSSSTVETSFRRNISNFSHPLSGLELPYADPYTPVAHLQNENVIVFPYTAQKSAESPPNSFSRSSKTVIVLASPRFPSLRYTHLCSVQNYSAPFFQHQSYDWCKRFDFTAPSLELLKSWFWSWQGSALWKSVQKSSFIEPNLTKTTQIYQSHTWLLPKKIKPFTHIDRESKLATVTSSTSIRKYYFFCDACYPLLSVATAPFSSSKHCSASIPLCLMHCGAPFLRLHSKVLIFKQLVVREEPCVSYWASRPFQTICWKFSKTEL